MLQRDWFLLEERVGVLVIRLLLGLGFPRESKLEKRWIRPAFEVLLMSLLRVLMRCNPLWRKVWREGVIWFRAREVSRFAKDLQGGTRL
jgi:hypothetical protein